MNFILKYLNKLTPIENLKGNSITIPFVNHIDIQTNNNELSLAFQENVLNHVNTIHAGAQFTLAETQSGKYLQQLFPELEGKVVPVVRDAQIKYKKPAVSKIMAQASISDDALKTFTAQFDKKGRGTLQVDVAVRDINDVVTAQATFTWFVQKI